MIVEFLIVGGVSAAIGFFVGASIGENKRRNAVDAVSEYYEGVIESIEGLVTDLEAKLEAKTKSKKAKPTQ